ncbi:hypothetical protein DOA20_24690 [Salmonella enterica subsp. enterica serovar Newport]|nr:hypothetical protein [Salmonella enterica subsp. enterica serovar Newport]
MNTQNVKTAASESTERWWKKTKSQLVAAADRAAMSVAYGREAADHEDIPYSLVQSVRDWLTGFAEGLQRHHR